MIPYLIERLKNLPFYLVIIVGVIFIGYKLFIQRTESQKTTIQAGGTANYYWKDAEVSPRFGGCVTLKGEKPKEIK